MLRRRESGWGWGFYPWGRTFAFPGWQCQMPLLCTTVTIQKEMLLAKTDEPCMAKEAQESLAAASATIPWQLRGCISCWQYPASVPHPPWY